MAIGTPSSLRRKVLGGEEVEVEADRVTREAVVALRGLPEVKALRWTDAGTMRLVVDDAAAATPAITETLHDRGSVVEAVRPAVPTFNDVFRRIVGADEERHD